MPTINLTQFEGDSIVLHFGGRASAVNAATFSEVIAAFLKLARSVDELIAADGYELEFVIEALGPGSFRAKIRRVKKSLKKALAPSTVTGMIFWGLVTCAIYDALKYILLESQRGVIITVTDGEVIYKDGNNTTIIRRDVYNRLPQVLASPTVQENTLQLMRSVQRDPTVTDFGLTVHMDDPVPTLMIPRTEIEMVSKKASFTTLAVRAPDVAREPNPAGRIVAERTTLRITTAQLKGINKKWGFEWGDKEISARITDAEFLAKLNSRDYLIGVGDALDVELTYKSLSEIGKTNVIDPKSFVVTKIFWKPELTGDDMKTGRGIKPVSLRLKRNLRS